MHLKIWLSTRSASAGTFFCLQRICSFAEFQLDRLRTKPALLASKAVTVLTIFFTRSPLRGINIKYYGAVKHM